MNEVALSDDLNVIATRINSRKQIIGHSLIEMGNDLSEAKKKDVSHGEWTSFLKVIGIHERQAQRLMKVATELGESKTTTWSDLPFRALYEIATLPQEEREKEHTLSSGETKTPDEMTVRELQEIKKQLKEVEQAKQQAEKQRDIERKERERLENQEPERIEVVPDDYDEIKGNYESAVGLMDYYKEQLEEMRKELNNISSSNNNSGKVDESEVKRLEEKEKMLKSKINSYDKLFDIQSNLEIVLSQIQSKKHSLKFENIKNEWGIIDELDGTLDEVIKVCKELKKQLPDKNIIEGDVIDG